MVQDAKLIDSLIAASHIKEKAGRATLREFPVWDDPAVSLQGWKFNEWDYGKSNIKLPINARGLFTIGSRIVVRGYDKFFNINEKRFTSWASIESNTVGPYSVSLKENGCIVFISGLENGTLVVTSKHSTGPRKNVATGQKEDLTTNHSYVALKWVEKHLSKTSHTKQDLALWLYERDLTAVGELCDDEFEEHILPYNGERRGIYLHGLNKNTAEFQTLDFEQVHQAAVEFGFLETRNLTFTKATELRSFLEECAKTGSWNGFAIEGFVIRCRQREDNSTFFFKYKFDEPYLMYREWREITKMLLRDSEEKIRFKKNKELGEKYLNFIKVVLQDKNVRDQYLHNKGIIKLREQFLNYLKTENPALTTESLVSKVVERDGKVMSKYVFVTVATIGCGKTTVSVALQKLTGWGHVQNDNISGSGSATKFANAIRKSLDDDSVAVIADRNNHMFRERAQIFNDVGYTKEDAVAYDLKFVCLNFLPTGPSSQTWSITRDRVRQRKDNHQSIKNMEDTQITGIMKGFTNRYQVVDVETSPDSLFDLVIDLDVSKGSEYNLRLILENVYNNNLFKPALESLPKFTDSEIKLAMEYALSYKPTVTKVVKTAKSSDYQEKYEFFALYVDPKKYDLAQLVESFFASNRSVDRSIWEQLKATGGVQSEFHVTILHIAGLKVQGGKSRFKNFAKLAKMSKLEKTIVKRLQILQIDALKSDVRIKKLGFSDNILALEVEVLNNDLQSANIIAHITVATLNVPAKESLNMLLSENSNIYDWNIEPAVLKNLHLAAYMRI